MHEKEIQLLQRQLDKLKEPKFDLESWKSATNIILSRIFSDSYQGIKSIEKIKLTGGGIYFGGHGSSWDNMESCKRQGREIILASISELEAFGLPDKKSPSKGGINISLTQNQTVNINLLLSALEDELTGVQLKEVKDIMKSTEPTEKKKSQLISKLKAFGGDVASNVLANLLSNPNIWG